MALNFPLSPSNGDIYNAPNGVTYIYDSISGYWNVQADDPGIVADGAITPAKLSVGGPTWDSNYRIGVNTENPVTMFHITGLPGTDPTIRMVDGDTAGYYELVNNAGSVELHADKGNSVAGTFLSISLDGSEFLRVTEQGLLGLGTTTPQQSFHLVHPTGNSNILIQGLTNSTNYVFFGDNESASQGIVSYDHNTDSFGIGTDGTEKMKIKSTGEVRFVSAFTVATLPAGEVGDIARVTDALSPSIGSTVSGGGSANALCWYNGTNWTVLGV